MGCNCNKTTESNQTKFGRCKFCIYSTVCLWIVSLITFVIVLCIEPLHNYLVLSTIPVILFTFWLSFHAMEYFRITSEKENYDLKNRNSIKS